MSATSKGQKRRWRAWLAAAKSGRVKRAESKKAETTAPRAERTNGNGRP